MVGVRGALRRAGRVESEKLTEKLWTNAEHN